MNTSNEESTVKFTASWRFRTGVTLIAIGWICPLFIPFVTRSTLSTEWKTALSGFLLVVGPELLSLTAIAMWALLFVYGSFVWYAPHLVPGYAENRIELNLTADFLFIVSLFVLGGDFWEKFRALFTYDTYEQSAE
jgi:hypothetical protein